MADVSCAFVVQKSQYKGETSRLAITHAISYQTVEILLEDGQTVTPALCFVGEGVLGLTKGQDAMKLYGVTSTESHFKNALLVDLKVYVCKEDLARYGIAESNLPDAEDMGAETTVNIVPMAEIKKIVNDARHVLVF